MPFLCFICATNGETIVVPARYWNDSSTLSKSVSRRESSSNAPSLLLLDDAEFAKELGKFGIAPMTGYTPEKTRALQEQQVREWSDAVKRMGITTAE